MENNNDYYEKILEGLRNNPISFDAIILYIGYYNPEIQNIALGRDNLDKKSKRLNKIISDIKNQVSAIRFEILSDNIKDFIEYQVYELFNQNVKNKNRRR